MTPENPINDALLAKYLAGETDALESEQVRRWLAGGDFARQEFSRFERIWHTVGTLDRPAPETEVPVDTDAAWQKMKSRMKSPPTSSTPEMFIATLRTPEPTVPPARPEAVVRPLPAAPRRNAWTYWSAAAVVLLALGFGWFFWREQASQPVPQLAVTTADGKIEKILPDGSRVYLNRNSRLSYPETFASDSREVTLTGEAFFDVRPDAARPFRIRAGQTTVQVLGTSFSIRAYDANVRVAVRTGKVLVKAKQKEVTLVKNEQAAFDADRDTLLKSTSDVANAFVFKTGVLSFSNDRLADVVQTLNETYQADIQLSSARLANCRLTARFENEKLDHVLAVAAESLRLRIRRNGSRTYLEGSGCE